MKIHSTIYKTIKKKSLGATNTKAREISRTYLVYEYDIINCLKLQYVIDMRRPLYVRDTRSFFYLHIESWRVTLQQL